MLRPFILALVLGVAVDAAAQSGPQATISELTTLLKGDDARERDQAATQLARRGKQGVTALVKVLQSRDAQVRIAALGGLRQTSGDESASAVEKVGELLGDDEAPVRVAAVAALRQLDEAQLMSEARALLADEAQEVRETIMLTYRQLADLTRLDEVMELTASEHDDVSAGMVGLLGSWVEAAADRLRPRAEEIVPALVTGLAAPDPMSKVHALRGLKTLGVDAVSAIEDVRPLTLRQDDVATTARETLAVLERAAGLVEPPPPPPVDIEAEIVALGDRDPQRQQAARQALASAGPAAAALVPKLVENVAYLSQPETLRRLEAIALIGVADARSVKTLLESPLWNSRIAAIVRGVYDALASARAPVADELMEVLERKPGPGVVVPELKVLQAVGKALGNQGAGAEPMAARLLAVAQSDTVGADAALGALAGLGPADVKVIAALEEMLFASQPRRFRAFPWASGCELRLRTSAEAAALALVRSGEPAAEVIQQALAAPRKEVVAPVLSALGCQDLDDTTVIAPLVAALELEEPGLRVLAARGLVNRGKPAHTALDRLQKLANDDPDQVVRRTCQAVLRSLKSSY